MTEELLPKPPGTPPIETGQIIGDRYLVGEVLGGGGMGVVRAGTHVLLGTPVAIKLIHAELRHDTEALQRFINEARAAAALKGEHIARVFDVGVLTSGEPYLVMEQLDGVSLDQYLAERGALTRAEAVDIVLQVCEGLAEAHAAGLVHRDIKPANLFLARRPDGQFSAKILDFGIAKRLDAPSPALTDPGKSLGSPWYMSPEQMLTPASVDAHADVWSLGVLLFELLTARVPFDGESVPQVCANVLAASPPRPSDFRPDLGPDLDAIVLHCLEKEPQRRFRSVSELGQALLPFASPPIHAAALTLDAPKARDSEPERGPGFAAFPVLQTPGYGSLTPLHADAASSRPARTTWQLALALVVVPVLLFGAFGAHALPSPDSAASSDESWTALEPTREPPLLLQYLDGARALPEVERPGNDPQRVRLTRERRARSAEDEAWLRGQELKRRHDAENRYGL